MSAGASPSSRAAERGGRSLGAELAAGAEVVKIQERHLTQTPELLPKTGSLAAEGVEGTLEQAPGSLSGGLVAAAMAARAGLVAAVPGQEAAPQATAEVVAGMDRRWVAGTAPAAVVEEASGSERFPEQMEVQPLRAEREPRAS